MSYKDTSVDDETQTHEARNKKGTSKLLARLIYHHGTDANMQVPEGWKPKPKRVPKPELFAFTAPAVPTPPFKELWFGIIDEITINPPQPRIEDIKRTICEHFKISHMDLTSERRVHTLARPRMIGMYLAREFTTKSLPEIARRFGRLDHSTTWSAVKRVKLLCQSDWKVAYDVAYLEAQFQ